MNEKEALASRLARYALRKVDDTVKELPFKLTVDGQRFTQGYRMFQNVKEAMLKLPIETLKTQVAMITPVKEDYEEALALWANEFHTNIIDMQGDDESDGEIVSMLVEVGCNFSAHVLSEMLAKLGYDIEVETETPESADLIDSTVRSIVPSTPEIPKITKPKFYAVELETTEYPWNCISFGEYLASVNVFYKNTGGTHHGMLIEYRCQDKKTLETMIREWWGSGDEDWDNEMLASITEVPSDEYCV